MEAFHYWFLILNVFFIEVGKVLTTSSGDGRVIWAKFKSFLEHAVDKHLDLEDPIFNKCAHDVEIEHRKWLDESE